MKFGMGVLCKTLWNKDELRENWGSDNDISLKAFLPSSSIFLDPISVQLVIQGVS
jgi:hypothetical protein